MADSKDKADPQATQPTPPKDELVPPFQPNPLLTQEAEDHRKALYNDWSQWVAADDIPHGGVLAYAAGDPVPASNVKGWRYDEQGLVVKTGSKAHRELLDKLAARTPAGQKRPGD